LEAKKTNEKILCFTRLPDSTVLSLLDKSPEMNEVTQSNSNELLELLIAFTTDQQFIWFSFNGRSFAAETDSAEDTIVICVRLILVYYLLRAALELKFVDIKR
jgi:hypothetical protein